MFIFSLKTTQYMYLVATHDCLFSKLNLIITSYYLEAKNNLEYCIPLFFAVTLFSRLELCPRK